MTLWSGERDTADSPTRLGGSVVSPVEASGHFQYRWRLFRSCGVQPAPYDSDSQWGGKATGQLTAEAPTGPLTGRIETTNRPADRAYRKDAPVVVKRMPYSVVHVTVDGKPHGLFCAAGAAGLTLPRGPRLIAEVNTAEAN